MFKTLTDTGKAAIFTGLVLLLAVAAALAINALGLASNEFGWGAVWSITPVTTVIMLLVVTHEGALEAKCLARNGGALLAQHVRRRAHGQCGVIAHLMHESTEGESNAGATNDSRIRTTKN